MLKCEIMSGTDLIKLIEVRRRDSIEMEEAINTYLNSKPGTWRLISTSVYTAKDRYETFHHFFWAVPER